MPEAHHAHVREIKSLASKFPHFAGIALDTLGNPSAVFRDHERASVIVLDPNEVRHVAIVLAGLKSPLPGVLDGTPTEGLYKDAEDELLTRSMPLQHAMEDYLRGYDQAARASEAMLKNGYAPNGKIFSLVVRAPESNLNDDQREALSHPPKDGSWSGKTLADFFSPHSIAGYLFKPSTEKTGLSFKILGINGLFRSPLLAEQSIGPTARSSFTEPVYHNIVPLAGFVRTVAAEVTAPATAAPAAVSQPDRAQRVAGAGAQAAAQQFASIPEPR